MANDAEATALTHFWGIRRLSSMLALVKHLLYHPWPVPSASVASLISRRM